MVLAGLASLAIPWALKVVFDDVLQKNDRGILDTVALVLLVILVIRLILTSLQVWASNLATEQLVTLLKTKLQLHLLQSPIETIENRGVGAIISLVQNDVDSVRGLLFPGLLRLINNVFFLLTALLFLLWLDAGLTLISLTFLPLFIIVAFGWAKKIRPVYRELREGMASVTGRLAEVFSGIRVVKSYSGEHTENQRFNKGLLGILQRIIHAVKLELFLKIGGEIAMIGGLILLVWLGSRRVLDGNLSRGELVAFYTLVMMLYSPIQSLAGSANLIQQGMASATRIFSALDEDTERFEGQAPPKKTDNSSLEFQKLTFKFFEDGPSVLKDISFEAKSGQMLAIVGPSGAGKTTLFALAARLYKPNNGTILFRAEDISKMALGPYRSHLAFVLQTDHVFNGSIIDNVSYAKPEASKEDIEEALKLVGAYEFATSLPQGLDTMLGEDACRLSGGQRARISLARAIVADPDLLLLDEATSCLDVESEIQVLQNLKPFFQKRITIFATHRLGVAAQADQIVYLNQGELKEQGTFKELIDSNGEFAQLVRLQQQRLLGET